MQLTRIVIYKRPESDYMRSRVRHSVGEYVNRHDPRVPSNGVASFWSMLRRGPHLIYSKIFPKRLCRYVANVAGRHNWWSPVTVEIVQLMLRHLDGKRLTYRELVGSM